MQPRKLTMKNFGPFICETVDFGDFQDAGLFLISGKTGAGKTTIFDGMTFALFGETSGQLRSGKEMRSMFATPEEETVVTFSFEHQGMLYEIERSPEQELKKKRGNGNKKQTAKVRLTIYNAQLEIQRQYSKRTEVDSLIKELLHLDAKQFFQIILLPQGEFRNFLIASSNEKEKLLRNLFGTGLYQQLNEWLRQKQKTMNQELSKQQHTIEALIERFQWQQTPKPFVSVKETLSDWQEELVFLTAQQTDYQAQLTTAKAVEKRAEEALYAGKEQMKIVAEYEQLQAEQLRLAAKKPVIEVRQQRVAELSWLEKQANLLTALEQARQEKQALTATLQQLTAEQEQQQVQLQIWQEQEPAIAEKRAQLTQAAHTSQRLADLLPSAAEVAELLAEQQRADEAAAVGAQTLQELQAELTAIEQQQAAVETILAAKDQLQQSEIRLIQAETAVARWSEQQAALNATIQQHTATTTALTALTDELQQQTTALTAAQQTLKDCQSTNAKMQIARLRLLLQEGEPCPVCGATEHSHEAAPQYTEAEIAASERALAAAEEAVRSQSAAQQTAHHQQVELQNKAAELAARQQEQTDKLQQLTRDCQKFLLLIEANATDLPQQLAQAQQELSAQQAALTQAEQEKQQLQQAQTTLLQRQRDLQADQQQQQSQRQQTATKIELLQAQLQQRTYEELHAQLAQATLEQDQLTAALAAYSEQGENLKTQAITLTEKINQQTQQSTRLQQKISEQEHQLSNAIAASAFDFTEETMHEQLTELAQLAELQEELTVYQQQTSFTEQRLQELTAIGIATPDLKQLQAAYAAAESRTEALQATVIQQQELQRHNQALFEELDDLSQQNAQKIATMMQLEQLFKTLNGDNPEKISIERYVLQSFLTEILTVANQRLVKLTRGRYQFLLAEQKGSYRSSTGLEINIYDDNAGMSRRAHTLSGGESFIAALALALSLADVIQNRSGGIAIEALFIDEGFGSLDEESLEMAMEALEMIENEGRMIGIISHVRELKDRIQQQLIVEAKGNGQSRIFSQLV